MVMDINIESRSSLVFNFIQYEAFRGYSQTGGKVFRPSFPKMYYVCPAIKKFDIALTY